MTWLIETLRAHPEIALFLTLALGYALTKLRVGPIQLNAVVAVLIAGVAIGQLQIDVPASLQWVFFVLFLFSIGYQTGPQFFRGLGRSALPQVGLALLLCGMVLASAYALAMFFGFDAGAGAGLLAGGLNASAAIGTAGDAIARLPVDPVARQALSTSLTVAFAVTYLVGLLTEIFTLTIVGPWLMRSDLAADCKKLEAEMGVGSGDAGVSSGYQGVVVRAYGVPARLDGRTVTEVERSFAPARVFAERLRTPEGIVDPDPLDGAADGPGARALRAARDAGRARESAGRHRGRRSGAAGHPHRHRRCGARREGAGRADAQGRGGDGRAG